MPPRFGNAKTGNANTSRVGNGASLRTFIDEVTKEFDGAVTRGCVGALHGEGMSPAEAATEHRRMLDNLGDHAVRRQAHDLWRPHAARRRLSSGDTDSKRTPAAILRSCMARFAFAQT